MFTKHVIDHLKTYIIKYFRLISARKILKKSSLNTILYIIKISYHLVHLTLNNNCLNVNRILDHTTTLCVGVLEIKIYLFFLYITFRFARKPIKKESKMSMGFTRFLVIPFSKILWGK